MLTPGDWPLGLLTVRAHKQRENKEERTERGIKRIEMYTELIRQTFHKSELSYPLRRLEEVSFPQVIMKAEGVSISRQHQNII